MDMMIFSGDDSGIDEFVSKDQVVDWLREIYTRVYGCAATDSRLSHMTSSLPWNSAQLSSKLPVKPR